MKTINCPKCDWGTGIEVDHYPIHGKRDGDDEKMDEYLNKELVIHLKEKHND